MDIVIAYTQAYKSKLLQLAVNHPHIYAIPWGTPVPTKPISCLNKMALRAKYGIRNNAKLMIWSGFIQQIKEDDFFKSVCVAREISRLKEVDFIFAIKPEDCKERYMRESSKNVKVLTHIKEFAKLLESADILFSPVGAERSIVTPPLTWIEAMMLGVPILTTRIEGINEVIIDGKTGFIAESYKSLLDKSIRILEMSNLESISHNAQIFARDKYDIEKIADHLVSVWNKEILL
jgi:glycosyltransferase involved in cell wall biosynthesis